MAILRIRRREKLVCSGSRPCQSVTCFKTSPFWRRPELRGLFLEKADDGQISSLSQLEEIMVSLVIPSFQGCRAVRSKSPQLQSSNLSRLPKKKAEGFLLSALHFLMSSRYNSYSQKRPHLSWVSPIGKHHLLGVSVLGFPYR